MIALLLFICTGLLGTSLFATGIIFGLTPLIAVGIGLTAFCILAMIVWHVWNPRSWSPRLPSQSQSQDHVRTPNPATYSTNNMNTMKRNKSDTDLELMRQDVEAEGV
jgi:biopolymer transport protein ExbD